MKKYCLVFFIKLQLCMLHSPLQRSFNFILLFINNCLDATNVIDIYFSQKKILLFIPHELLKLCLTFPF